MRATSRCFQRCIPFWHKRRTRAGELVLAVVPLRAAVGVVLAELAIVHIRGHAFRVLKPPQLMVCRCLWSDNEVQRNRSFHI